MKKFSALIFGFVFLFQSLSPVFAQSLLSPTPASTNTMYTEPGSQGSTDAVDEPTDPAIRINPPGKPQIIDQTTTNFLGQDHSYTVTMRGNGEAVVNLRVILSNTFDLPLSTVNLRVPRVDPKDIIVYQVIREPYCIRYQPYIKGQTTQICAQYSEADFSQYYYGGGNKYQKASYEMKGDTIAVTLPRPIKSNGQGSFILYYRALGYAKKNAVGAYDFSFETIKVEDKIRQLQVAVDTDSDLYLKGAKGNINYRQTLEMADLKMAAPSSTSFSNGQFDSYYQQIGQGSLVKTASNLQSLESYTVKGTYADAKWKLYAGQILIGLGVCILGFLILLLIVKLVLRMIHRNQSNDPSSHTGVNTTGMKLLTVVGLGFVSSFVIVLYTVSIYALLSSTQSYSYISSNFLPLLLILLAVTSLGIYALLLFAPALFIGLKKGWGMGVWVFVSTILWLLSFLVVIFIVFSLFFSNSYDDGSTPVMERPLMMQSAPAAGLDDSVDLE